MKAKSRKNILFYDEYLCDTLSKNQAPIASKVDSIPLGQFLNTHIEELTQLILSRFKVEPITLYEDRKLMEEPRETKIDTLEEKGFLLRNFLDFMTFPHYEKYYVTGTEVVVTIPYSGDQFLWKQCPIEYSSLSSPRGEVHAPGPDEIGQIKISIILPIDVAKEKFKINLDEQLSSIKFYVDAQRKLIEKYNAENANIISTAIAARRERQKISGSLKIPLIQQEGTPPIEPIKIARKLVRPLPSSSKTGCQEEPGITDESYKHILSVIRHVGRTFETTPKTYLVHNEEDLRNILMANLNGHYQGDAMGEAFRRSGKTDIRIENQNRAAFVAECKVWRGKQELYEAIDQLLGYLTWRDCKAALIIFNKNVAKFTELLNRIPKTIHAHEKFRQMLNNGGDGEWEYLMTSREDEARQVRVHVFVFNIYPE